MALYIHLRGKTYIHKERVKVRERYKTRVIRATRLKIYSLKFLPPSLLLLSSVAPHKNLGKYILPARNRDRCLQKPPLKLDLKKRTGLGFSFLALCSSLFLSLSLSLFGVKT